MASIEIQKRILKLRELIEHYRMQYHVYDKSEISDEALDSLKKELVELEDKYPELVTPDSPTQRVAGGIKDGLLKVRHQVRQWSLNDCFSPDEFLKFDERVKRFLKKDSKENTDEAIEYVCEHKIDGLKIILEYKKGVFWRGSTRGDGEIGEDVTHNIRTIESVPLKLSLPIDIIVEGEVWMKKSVFKTLNDERKKAGMELFANPRNIAAGSLRQLDPAIAASRKLEVFIYDVAKYENSDSKNILSQEKELHFLQKLGFKVNKNFKLCLNAGEVIEYWQKWEKNKDKEDYFFDGVVVKVNDALLQEKLGYTGKAPRYAIAFKFKAEQVTTIIEDIAFQVGRTGVITPVAHLKPVLVYGSTVSRATLHNEDEIKRLDVRIGDTVILQKAGDVIPDIVSVLKDLRVGKEKIFVMPKTCPVCDSVLVKKSIGAKVQKNNDQSAAWYCENKKCPAKDRKKLYYFTSKSGFNIDGLGPKIIDALCDNNLVVTPADFFTLEKGDLLLLPRFAEKSVDNLLASIEKARRVELSRLITALSIPQVGVETAYDLANHFRDISKIANASPEELSAIDGIGDVIVREIALWFRDKHNTQMLQALLAELQVIAPTKKVKTKKVIVNKTFVLTGTMVAMDRDEAKKQIKSLGGEVSGTVSKNTDYVVVGENPGSKLDKARELGVKILDEEAFLKLIAE